MRLLVNVLMLLLLRLSGHYMKLVGGNSVQLATITSLIETDLAIERIIYSYAAFAFLTYSS